MTVTEISKLKGRSVDYRAYQGEYSMVANPTPTKVWRIPFAVAGRSYLDNGIIGGQKNLFIV